ncbi:MAG: hypothetical protein SVT56_03945 [Chloroflexota bacterium]|jgi:hypothetical protein|nr:hypothetical protein [Chloroflexota bacterium]
MAFRVTNEWIINLPHDFERRVEDEKLIFWKTGITVIIAAFTLPEDTGKLELLNQIQKKMPEDVLEAFVSTKGEIVGLGYTQVQDIKGENDRLALTTFTASDTSCIQTAFYLDDPAADLDWAKSVWENLVYHPETENETSINT